MLIRQSFSKMIKLIQLKASVTAERPGGGKIKITIIYDTQVSLQQVKNDLEKQLLKSAQLMKRTHAELNIDLSQDGKILNISSLKSDYTKYLTETMEILKDIKKTNPQDVDVKKECDERIKILERMKLELENTQNVTLKKITMLSKRETIEESEGLPVDVTGSKLTFGSYDRIRLIKRKHDVETSIPKIRSARTGEGRARNISDLFGSATITTKYRYKKRYPNLLLERLRQESQSALLAAGKPVTEETVKMRELNVKAEEFTLDEFKSFLRTYNFDTLLGYIEEMEQKNPVDIDEIQIEINKLKTNLRGLQGLEVELEIVQKDDGSRVFQISYPLCTDAEINNFQISLD